MSADQDFHVQNPGVNLCKNHPGYFMLFFKTIRNLSLLAHGKMWRLQDLPGWCVSPEETILAMKKLAEIIQAAR